VTVDINPAAGAEAPIRVLFVSTSYPRDATDWRGIFMSHINAALARRPGLKLMQWSPPGRMDAAIEYVATESEAAWLAKLMERGGISHWLRTRPASGTAAAGKLLRLLRSVYRRTDKVDLYHINWLQCALPLPANGKPALMTVLGNDMRLLRLPGMRSALRRALRGRNIAICPNASWMEAPLRETFGDLAAIVSVPFGIDPRWYAIRRNAADLSQPSRWLAVTRLTANKLGPLFEWSEPLFADRRRELHLFGPMQEQVAVPDWVVYHGSATPEQLSREWFPHAHGLITLSRHAEGRPQVMLEAMAASLPIVASRMPAHADIVTDGATGALCDTPSDYANALDMLEKPGDNLRFGNAARAWVTREIGTWDDCAGRYATIYRRLLEQPTHG
jgi:glycosyltransferase involved in cell wall biosynthesis